MGILKLLSRKDNMAQPTKKEKQIQASFARGFRSGTIASQKAIENLEQQIEGISNERDRLYRELNDVTENYNELKVDYERNRILMGDVEKLNTRIDEVEKRYTQLLQKYYRTLEEFKDYAVDHT